MAGMRRKGTVRIVVFGLVAALFATSAWAQRIHRWVDKDGVVHYSQTPPTGHETSEVDLKVRPDSPEFQAFCRVVRRYSINIMQGLNRGLSSDAAMAIARRDDGELAGLIDNANLRNIVNYVYTAQHARQTIAGVADNIHEQCLNGAFGAPRSTGGEGSAAHAGRSTPGTVGKRGGTGFVAAGRVVTNHHVIDGAMRITVHFSDGRQGNARIESQDRQSDLAVLQVETSGSLPPGLPMAASPARMGAQVFTVGFPHPRILGDNAKLSTGLVSATTGMGDDPRTYQISVPLQGGNSGGPLLNSRGEVVGVVTAKLAAMRVFEYTGDMPENVSFAVKASYLGGLLRAHSSESLKPGDGSLEDLAERVRPSVVRIVVN